MKRQKITYKTLTIALITFGVIMLLLVVSARLIILSDFEQLEDRLARQNMQRVLSALDNDAKGLVRTLGDWCAWDDTFAFVKGDNSDYVASNLIAETFANLDLQLILLADRTKRIQWGRVYDRDQDALLPIPVETEHYLADRATLWEHGSPESRNAGILNAPHGLMMIASGPIVNNNNQGPIGGTMIMARALDPRAVENLAARMQLPITLRTQDLNADPSHSSDPHLTYLRHRAVTVETTDRNTLRAAVVVNDIGGLPVLEIQFSTLRDVYAQGQRTIRYFIYWLGGSGVLVTLIALSLLRRTVLKPIASLNAQMAIIAANSSFSDRLVNSSTDEVGQLSQTINQMLSTLDRANRELMDAYAQLQATQVKLVQSAKLASIGELAAGVAHELNQPLMVIRGTTQLITRGLTSGRLKTADLDEQLNMVIRNTNRMINIIEHLRTFSRQASRQKTRVDVNRTIRDCFLLLGEQLRVREIDVEVTLSDGLPRVWADQNQLEQVLLNLIANARDAILENAALRDGPQSGVLRLSTHPVDGTSKAVEIRVQDNGGGIHPEHLEKIFDPFFTTKEVGKGTGLGLSISYGIVNDFGGDLRVGETGPTGTTFVIQLPVEDGAADGSAVEPDQSTPSAC